MTCKLFLTTLLSVFVVLTVCLSAEFSDYGGCVFKVEDSNGITSTYNLSLFHLSDSVYRIKQNDYVETQREYLFNICGRIPLSIWESDLIRDTCTNNSLQKDIHGPCETWNDDGTCNVIYDVISEGKSATALQYTHSGCHWSGSELDGSITSPDYNISLYNNDDSASSIKFTLRNGDYCDKSSHGVYFTNRELNIELKCPDSPREYFNPIDELDITEEVVQYPTCIYTLSYETALACPRECIAVNTSFIKEKGDIYSVCNGRGICVADPNYGQSRCLCDDGYTGDLCTQKFYDVEVINNTHGGSSISAITWICVVLLVIMLIFSVVLCHKIRMQERYVVGQQQGQYVQGMLDADDQGQNGSGVSMGVGSTPIQPKQSGLNPLMPQDDNIAITNDGADQDGADVENDNENNNVE